MSPAFDLWTGMVSARLMDYTGRGLADAPVWMIRPLAEWWQQGWSACDVAERLANCRWPARVTMRQVFHLEHLERRKV